MVACSGVRRFGPFLRGQVEEPRVVQRVLKALDVGVVAGEHLFFRWLHQGGGRGQTGHPVGR